MSYAFSAFSLPLLLTSVLCGALALYVWRFRAEQRGGMAYVRLMVVVGAWTLAYAIEILGADVATKEIWESVIISCIALVAPLWLILAVEHTGREHWLSRRNTFLVFFPAAVTILMVVTNSLHHLVWTEIRIDSAGPFLATLPVRAPWFWVHASVTWVYLAGGLVLYGLSVMYAPRPYRLQGYVMIIGALLPLVGNLLHLVGAVPVPGLDLGPFAFAVSCFVMAVGLFRYRLLDLAPVARRAILESMREGIIVIDKRERVVEINPAARQMLALSDTDVIGRDNVLRPLMDRAEMDSTELPEELLLSHDNINRWITVSASPLSDSGGRSLGRMIVLRDTTEEHHLEQMREDLRCMLVHDLRNPLTVIDMGLSMLKRAQDQLPSDLQPVVDMAWANSSRALMLVNAILDVARLEQGRMPMEAEAISLSEIASKVVFSMTPLAWEYSVRVETVNRGALPPAWADGRLVTRIVQNLIDNAIKFSPKGGVVLVSVGELEGHPGISVSDNGPGMSQELRGQLFQEFVTGHQERRGTGMGLVFCRLAVDAQGGRIWVESAPGEGTTISFRLPPQAAQQASVDS
jgi:PAS domain S-box-containing protein